MSTQQNQSAGGKLVDVVFITGIAVLLYLGKLSEISAVLLFAAIAQARGAVGAISKIASAMGVDTNRNGPSERPPGSGSSSGGMRAVAPAVVLPPETPPRPRDTFVKRLAVGAVREESAIGWGLAAFALTAQGVWGPVSRVRGSSAVLAVVILCLGCVR